MRKRRVYLVLLILAVAGVVGVIVEGAFREREPEYGGKRLSEWVKGIGASRAGGRVRRMGIGDTEREAIHHIGTNAVPYLVKFMRYEQPAWKHNLYGSISRALRFDVVDGREALARGAVAAFDILGPDGEAALPELLRLTRDTRLPQSANRALVVMVTSHFFRTNVFQEIPFEGPALRAPR